MSSDKDEAEVLRLRHERKMQLQRERRQRQREAKERPEILNETQIEKQLRLIADSVKKEELDFDDEEDEDDLNDTSELDLINGNYGREIREIFQQIEDPDERARLRRARRAQMQRLRRKRIRDAAATSYPQNGSSLGSRRQSVDLESESASRSMASSPRDTPQPDLKLTAEEIKLEKQRADTRERQRRRRARLSAEKREAELEAGRERQRRRRARLSAEKQEQEREASRLRMQQRRALNTPLSRVKGEEVDMLSDYDDELDEDQSKKRFESDLSNDEEMGMTDDEKSNSVPAVLASNGKQNQFGMDESTFTLLLIKRISEEPSLYDINDENYTNDNLRHRAFMRIQEKLEREGATIPQATSVRDKFRILKRRFISEHERYGSESKWSLYKPLRFMIPYVEATNLRKRVKPGANSAFKRKHESPAPNLDVKVFLESLSQVQRKFQNEYSRASSSNQFDDYDSRMDSAEKIQFYKQFRQWFSLHPTSPICTRSQYNLILSALKQKARGQEFGNDQMEEYNLACKFKLDQGDSEPIIVAKGTEKQVVCEEDVYDIMLQQHLASNHGRRDAMTKRLSLYDGLATRNLILMFLKCCQTCELANGVVAEKPAQLQRSGSFYENQNSNDGDSSTTNNYNLSMFLTPNERRTLQNGNSHRSPSRGSSASNNDGGFDTLEAYRIRQTYIFMRVLRTNKPVFVKANDEDFFPSHRTNTTAADRASWTAGQIVNAFFDFEQKETECVIEAVGEREQVQDFFQNVIIQEALEQQKSTENGIQNGVDLSGLLQNGHSEDLDQDESSANAWLLNNIASVTTTSQPPSKLPRLDANILTNEAIVARFEKLEERIRQVENWKHKQEDQENGHENGKEIQENGQEVNDTPDQEPNPLETIEVEIDNVRFDLMRAPVDELKKQIEQNKTKIMDEEKELIVSERNLYEEFQDFDFSPELKSEAPVEFGTKVISLLLDEETLRQSWLPSLTDSEVKQSTSSTLRPLSTLFISIFKKLLLFMGGSAICPEQQDQWLDEIRWSLQRRLCSHNFEWPPSQAVFAGEDVWLKDRKISAVSEISNISAEEAMEE